MVATQEEVDREVQKIAKQQREAVALTRAKLQKDGVINRIAGNIRTEKTLNFLFEHARKEAPPAKQESEDSESGGLVVRSSERIVHEGSRPHRNASLPGMHEITVPMSISDSQFECLQKIHSQSVVSIVFRHNVAFSWRAHFAQNRVNFLRCTD